MFHLIFKFEIIKDNFLQGLSSLNDYKSGFSNITFQKAVSCLIESSPEKFNLCL